MDGKQAVFEQLTLSELRSGVPQHWKPSNNYTIMMTNNSDNMKISGVVLLSLLLTYELIQ